MSIFLLLTSGGPSSSFAPGFEILSTGLASATSAAVLTSAGLATVVGLAFFLTTTPFSPFLISFLAARGFTFALGGGGGGGCPVTGGPVALTALVRAATAL